MTKALGLSGGGARGSFQLGALSALYEVYGFRPDVIAGTSVGSVNAIMLAQAPAPAVNDSGAILADAARGVIDPGLRRLRQLQSEWDTFTSPAAFFTIQPAFAGTLIEGFLSSTSASAPGTEPAHISVSRMVDEATALIATPGVNLIGGPAVADKLQSLKGAIVNALTQNSVTTLDPIAARLNDATKLDLTTLAAGTPVYFAMVALESGRLRYCDGRGVFTERDGRSPVVTALMDSDLDAARDENLQPLEATRLARLKDLNARLRAGFARIASLRAEHAAGSTARIRRAQIETDLPRWRARTEYLVGALRNQLTGIRITSGADPRRAVLASAAIPVYFDPIVIGAERYIDGGIREILPMEIMQARGVTELVGISCSTTSLPEADELSAAGLPTVGLRALTEIALHEIAHGDIRDGERILQSAVVIAPEFDVHGGIQVEPDLIDLSIDYGWMRACDEMHRVQTTSERELFRATSRIISRIRRDRLPFESDMLAFNPISRSQTLPAAHEGLEQLRLRAWAIWELLERRSELGLPRPPRATRWWDGWSRTMRVGGPYGGIPSVWSEQNAPAASGPMLIGSAGVKPDIAGYDGGAIVDEGNDRVAWVVRGAVFAASTETETTTTRSPLAVVPQGTAGWLPKVPRGRHLLADESDPATVWIVGNRQRFASGTPGLMSAAGLTGGPVALVPVGGLAQIPIGTDTSWLGRVAVTDNVRTRLDVWGPTAQEAGTDTSTAIGVSNFTGSSIAITSVTISTDGDLPGAPVIRPDVPLPITVPGGGFAWIGLRFTPAVTGPIRGRVVLTSDDALTPIFGVDIATSAYPVGPIGFLEVTPAALDFGVARVGSELGQNLTLRNVGSKALGIPNMAITAADSTAGFAIPLSWTTQLLPNQSTTVYVSCRPAATGTLGGTLAIDTTTMADTGREHERTVEVRLSVTAAAPQALLAGAALHAPLRPGSGLPTFPDGRRPIGQRLPRLVPELTLLDFGAATPGTDVRRTFWVRNIGDAPLRVVDVASTAPGRFGIPDLSGLPATVAPGGEIAIDANYLALPTPGAGSTGELRISTDDPFRPIASLPVQGRSTGPRLAMTGELLDLGEGAPPADGDFVLLSAGTDPVAVRKVDVLDDPSFTVTTTPAVPAMLAPGDTLTLRVSVSGGPGVHTGRVLLGHNAQGGQTTVQLRAVVL